MMASHLVPGESFLQQLAAGIPAALFAVLSGMSMHIIVDKSTTVRFINREMVVRGILLILIGFALLPFAHTIQVVLFSIGAGFILINFAPRLPNAWLLTFLATTTALSAVVYYMMMNHNFWLPLVTSAYPLFTWITYMLAGVLGYRFLVESTAFRVPAMIAGLVAVAVLVPLREHISDVGYTALISATAHSGGLADIAITIAASLGLISALVSAKATQRFLLPLQAMGAMSLSMYILHVVTAGLFLTGSSYPMYTNMLAVSIAGALIFAMLWTLRGPRRGPAEELIARITKKIR